jgi:hypothetical protein
LTKFRWRCRFDDPVELAVVFYAAVLTENASVPYAQVIL